MFKKSFKRNFPIVINFLKKKNPAKFKALS